jgi:4-amino-4-deoxy-L-arabinose transferase-like glycosyltransferase
VTSDALNARLASDRRAAPPAWLIVFLLAVTAARLLAAALVPLTEDEAYYRLWAQSLQLGYYDHPPMIAWWIRGGMSLLGDNALGIRLVPSLACGLTGLLIFDLALRLGADAGTAARASVWYNATLLIGMGGGLATPDAAATPFWVATLWCLARTRAPRGDGWWLGAGAAAGLACLSKYSSLFIAPGVVLWLALTPPGLSSLRRPWPWAAAIIAAALFGLNVAWNANHHWVTFHKQFGRLEPHGLKPGYLVELLASQVVLLNPLISVFAIPGLRGPWRTKPAPGQLDPRLPLATALPFFAYLMLHSLHDRVQAHWPAPIYPALVLVAAAVAQHAPASGWRASLRAAAAPVGLGLSALVMAHLALPITDIRGLNDPSGAIRGWPGFTRQIEQLRLAHGAAWIGTLSYGAAAQLDAAGETAPVVQIAERDRYLPGDGSWRADMSRPGLLVDLKRRMNPKALGDCFAVVTPLGDVVRHIGASRPDRYSVYLIAQPRRDVLARGCFTDDARHGL